MRIFNTYGPKMALDDGRVVSNFVAQALTNQPITVYGDGQQTRSFQFISDLVAGMVAVMDGDEIGPFNIGNPGEFTMLELANVSTAGLVHLCSVSGRHQIIGSIIMLVPGTDCSKAAKGRCRVVVPAQHQHRGKSLEN